jgi:four helix bundle protein
VVYVVTRSLPQRDQFVLGNELRRAAISIAANIAGGRGRNGDGELRRFLNIALGSANELRSLLELSADAGVLPRGVTDPRMVAADEIRRMLSSLAAASDAGRRPSRKQGAATGRAPSKVLIADS